MKIFHRKQAASVICTVRSQPDPVLSGVKGLLSLGVSWVALMSGSEHAEAQSRATEERQHEWQRGRQRRLGQILFYLAQNPLGLLGELQWITLSLMICRYTEKKGAGTSRAGVYLLDLTLWSGPQINPTDKEIEPLCVCVCMCVCVCVCVCERSDKDLVCIHLVCEYECVWRCLSLE